MVAVAVISAALAAGLACLMRFDRPHDWMGLAWLGNVAIFVAGYAFWIYRMESHHPWKWLVLLFMVLGLFAIALIDAADFGALWRPMLLLVGLVWLGSGGATLYSYIRHTAPPAPGAE
jgi:drug/metabolite transporter (DMT)-like permease